MPFLIGDGEGSGRVAGVDKKFRVKGNVVAVGPLETESNLDGNAGFFSSTFATGGTDVEVISIQNTEAKHLHITRMFLAASAIGTWDLLEVTGGTPAGTTITHVNPNMSSGKVNTTTSFGNAAVTGSVVGDTIALIRTLADVSYDVFIEGAIILGTNDTFAISFSVSATVYLTVVGFWEEE